MMANYDRVFDVFKWTGIICLFVTFLYFTLKTRDKWESFVRYLGTIFGFFLGTPGLSDGEFLRAQERRELRLKILRERNDLCPYCKFNLRSGADKCDECGKLFYEPEEGT
jgi:hypothetical protein